MNRKNNFDFLRLLFASFVIVSHSYPLTAAPGPDWLCRLTNGQVMFSQIGVHGFFTISGFLIFKSLERSRHLPEFYIKRILRLFPGLFAVLVLTVLLGPFVYDGTLLSYLKNATVWSYIPNNLLLYKIQYEIKGVFEHIPYKSAINGSLWTLAYEFSMYIVLSALFFIRNKKRTASAMLLVYYFGAVIADMFLKKQITGTIFHLDAGLLVGLSCFFAGGALIASYSLDKSKHWNLIAAAAFAILITSLIYNGFEKLQLITFPFIIIWLGLRATPVISDLANKIGDLSYGIYIYGFPVQQTLMYYYGDMTSLQLMSAALPISTFLAYLSWHFIEVKALKYGTRWYTLKFFSISFKRKSLNS